MLSVAIALTSLMFLSACASGVAPATYPTSVASSYKNSDPSSPTIKDDQYSPTIDVKTEAGEHGQAGFGNGTQLYGLFAKINRKSGAVVIYVQWSEVYLDRAWRFYSRASSSRGQPYSFDKVDRSVSKCSSGSCVYAETYNIMLPAADLKAGARDGISFKIYGKRGDERVVELPAALIEQFNAKVVEAQQLRKT